jgi:hypothetical protein
MASSTKNTTGANKKLLSDVTKLLGFSEPLYGTLNGNSHVACVVIFTSKGALPYFRVGHVSMNLIGSEESAAGHCLQSLVKDFVVCTEHMDTGMGRLCEQCARFFDLSSTRGSIEGETCVDIPHETISNTSKDECLTPTDPSSRIPCCTLPPPPKKRRVNWFPVVAPHTPQLIHLPSNFPDLFPKKKGGR